MKKCRECASEIAEEATRCPHCRAKQGSWFARHPFLPLLAIGAVGMFLIVLGVILQPSAPKDPQQGQFSAARGACLIGMKQHLHDPDTAQLDPNRSWSVEYLGADIITVRVSGRAKNALGAYQRGEWDCVVKFQGESVSVWSISQIP